MVPEAPLEQKAGGLVPGGEGWFVVNSREARWRSADGRGAQVSFDGWPDGYFPQIGIALFVLGPGEPIGMYDWEADQEDFLVRSGEALLLIEGGERRLRQWDFVHCPPGTKHIILGPEMGLALCWPSAHGSIRTLTSGAPTPLMRLRSATAPAWIRRRLRRRRHTRRSASRADAVQRGWLPGPENA